METQEKTITGAGVNNYSQTDIDKKRQSVADIIARLNENVHANDLIVDEYGHEEILKNQLSDLAKIKEAEEEEARKKAEEEEAARLKALAEAEAAAKAQPKKEKAVAPEHFSINVGDKSNTAYTKDSGYHAETPDTEPAPRITGTSLIDTLKNTAKSVTNASASISDYAKKLTSIFKPKKRDADIYDDDDDDDEEKINTAFFNISDKPIDTSDLHFYAGQVEIKGDEAPETELPAPEVPVAPAPPEEKPAPVHTLADDIPDNEAADSSEVERYYDTFNRLALNRNKSKSLLAICIIDPDLKTINIIQNFNQFRDISEQCNYNLSFSYAYIVTDKGIQCFSSNAPYSIIHAAVEDIRKILMTTKGKAVNLKIQQLQSLHIFQSIYRDQER